MNLTCCPRECPRRSVSCHNGCQTYMRYKQRMKAVDEVGFHRDVRKAVEKRRERKIRYDNR